MSEVFSEAEAQLSYLPPADLPVEVLSVSYGEALAVPDLVDVVNVAFQHTGRPGVLVETTAKVGNWQRSMDVLIRRGLRDVEAIYATLPGWPEPSIAPPSDAPPLGDVPIRGGGVVPV